jgi:hypothetical protein
METPTHVALRVVLATAIIAASAGQASAQSGVKAEPDWPCPQIETPTFSLAHVWAGPPLDLGKANDLLDAACPTSTAIKLILANHSAHVSKETKAWLATQPEGRFTFVLTPKHGSWLNLQGTRVKLFYRLIRLARKSSSHPAVFRLSRREVFPGANRIRFCAMCLIVQKLAGA